MSYSFNVRAQTKQAAKDAVAAEFAKVVAQQLVHEKDRDAVLANAGAVIDLLHGNPDKDQGKEIGVHVSGYVCWHGADAADLTTVSISCGASYVDRPAADSAPA